jgi:hypothetical protein
VHSFDMADPVLLYRTSGLSIDDVSIGEEAMFL